jgi:ADP-dependent NAD(P)H-hydrate dehydratase
MTGPAPVTPELLRKSPLPDAGASKHSRGHALIIGGAAATPGAVMLAGIAALRVGAGVLALAAPDAVAVPMAVTVPEASVTGWGGPKAADIDLTAFDALLAQADAVTIGPGLDDAEVARALVEHVATSDFAGPVLLDAYALGVLADLEDGVAATLAGRLVLTPNRKEAERLVGSGAEGQGDAGLAQQIADRWHAVVSCFGVIASAGADAHAVSTGHVGLGTSGSGDVLAGAVGGLLARGADPVRAASWGTYLHAASGDRLAARVGRLGFLARELLDELPLVLTELQA